MLVLSRKCGERVRIGEDVTFVILEVKANRVRIGIEAPPRVLILREELRGSAPAAAAENTIDEREIYYAAINP